MRLFDAILETVKPAMVKPVCILPIQAAKPEPVKKPKPIPSIYDIDQERREYGFHIEKMADREGAVKYLTGYDRRTLEQRDLWGGKGVQAQNAKAKALWHGGETAGEAARQMGLSESWVEKRFASFSTALSEEVADTGKK